MNKSNKVSQYKIRYTSGHWYNQMSTINHIYQVQFTMSMQDFSFVNNCVSEHQLPHAVDTSHTTPITHVNRGPKLLKLIGWRHCPCFRLSLIHI